MNISALPAPLNTIVIENERGTYKDFHASSDYPLKGVTYPVDYGYLPGYLGEDKADLDFFVGSEEAGLSGFVRVSRPDTENGETKFFINMSASDVEKVNEAFKPVLLESHTYPVQKELFGALEPFKTNLKPIQNIIYKFPRSIANDQDFFKYLCAILLELPNAQLQEDHSVKIITLKPANAFPITTFAQSDVPFPQLCFDPAELSLSVGNVQVNPEQTLDYEIDDRGFTQVITKQDVHGAYYELHAGADTIYRLDIQEVATRLKSHIVRIDHTGFNVPSALISRKSWEHFVGSIAKQSNLYKYPTGEDWPFILPATSTEYNAEITQFPVGREPKFELVYDIYSPVPTIQIDVETNLTRVQIEQLFPEPYGISFPELADFFRTVYVQHPWSGLAIRFDIRFRNDEPGGDWETGKWLVTEGGRII